MARREYGGDTTSFTTTGAGLIRGGLDVWFWTARNGGTRITQITPVGDTGATVTDGVLVTGPDAFIDVLGPEGYDAAGIWISADDAAPRRYLRALYLSDAEDTGGGGSTPEPTPGVYLPAYAAAY